QLENGLRVIVVPQKTALAVTVLVVVGAGSKYEAKKNNGVSHFLEHMFFKGTKKRPSALKVAETLDKVGGAYNAFTSKEYTGYYAKVEHAYFDLALDWVSDIFLNSQIPQVEINKERGVIVEEINMYQDAPMQDVENVWEELLYGDTPAGWRVIGSKENILNLQRKDLIDYLKKHYSSQNTIVCLSGNFQEKEAIEKVKKYFRSIPNATIVGKEIVKEVQVESQVKVFFKETDQTHFCLGVRGYSLISSERYMQDILGIILGGNMSSRLFIEIREKRGLAYYIHTLSESYTDSGFLVTQAGVAHRDLPLAIELILKEYASIAKKGVTPAELQKAKDYLKGALTLSLESSDALASFYGAQELLSGEILTLQQKLAIINKITLGDIKRVAQNIFQNKNLNLALIGPHKNEKELWKLLKV
ncbi:MAG: pitrilysin family protein, partial [Candidatus Gribaldobacteria bacterium]|nr:pitrilysin family protein [Candidatus Gribaldobacteria bacterium]